MKAKLADVGKMGPMIKQLTNEQVAKIVSSRVADPYSSIVAKDGQNHAVQRLDQGGWVVQLEN